MQTVIVLHNREKPIEVYATDQDVCSVFGVDNIKDIMEYTAIEFPVLHADSMLRARREAYQDLKKLNGDPPYDTLQDIESVADGSFEASLPKKYEDMTGFPFTDVNQIAKWSGYAK